MTQEYEIDPTNDGFQIFENIAFVMQEYIRLILAFIILSNFIIIVFLKFSLRKKSKRKEFINDLSISTEEYSNKENINIKKKIILILIAHPDDETMFFYPTIKGLQNLISSKELSLVKNEEKITLFDIHVLCLTKGNYYGLGDERVKEFDVSMKRLNINNYKILDFEDSMKVHNNYDDVSNSISKYINSNGGIDNLKAIFSFDENGVTSHPNHISCYEGMM